MAWMILVEKRDVYHLLRLPILPTWESEHIFKCGFCGETYDIPENDAENLKKCSETYDKWKHGAFESEECIIQLREQQRQMENPDPIDKTIHAVREAKREYGE
jgi:hypothetical protein